MSFVFVSGNLALDLVGTLKWRRDVSEELLNAPGDLSRWAVEAGVLSEKPAVDEAGLHRLIVLREAVYRLVRKGMAEQPWSDDDLRLVNAESGGIRPRISLTPAGAVRAGDIEAIAAEVAHSAVELLADIERLPLRECSHTACTRLFLDHSRGGNRQWCGMEECGNRVKSAAYRARKAKISAKAAR